MECVEYKTKIFKSSFSTTIPKSSLYDESNAYILVKGIIRITGAGADAPARREDERNNIRNCASFTDCVSDIYNSQVDHAKDLYVVMLMYNLIEYSGKYANISGPLWQYQKMIKIIT